jgi:bacterial/archaeal transporter family protein
VSQNELLGTILLIITMLLWGTTPILEKIGLREVDPLTGVLVRSLTITIILLVIYICTGRISELPHIGLKNASLFAASGILAGLVAMWTYFYVLKTGMTSKIVPIAASYPLVTALLGMFFLGEAMTVQRMIGILLTILGIVLVKQS